jgi:23S rRNA (adenine2503-C2)-methyltransferase
MSTIAYLCLYIMAAKKDIRKLSEQELISLFTQNGEAAFRARQVYQWLWQKRALNFAEMTNLSKELRNFLEEHFSILPVNISEKQISQDKTIKCAMKLHDGYVVESVLIPAGKRMTACISSQVGCSLTCKFCATGKLKRMRNLNADEIFDQVVLMHETATEHYGNKLSNIVYMGMGEPLLNYSEVMKSIQKITSPEGLGMSPQRITVSTAGVAKMIHTLADDNVRFNLALSLHAANDEKRNYIMPINETNSLDNLQTALKHFSDKTGTRVTLEYIAFHEFNDSTKDAIELADFCKKIKAKVNIIEYNPIDEGEFRQTSPERLSNFRSILEKNGVVVNVRRSRGKDIDAACGQLANKNKLATENQPNINIKKS